MKTIKRNSEIKRVKDSSTMDRKRLEDMLNAGWNYCPKSEWKSTRVKKEVKPEKKEGDKKRGKNS